MFWYSIRRLNLFVITLLILTFVGYSLVRLEPQSHWAAQPMMAGWFEYLSRLIELDFGLTKAGVPITQELASVLPATLELCFAAFTISVFLGIPAGTIAGMRKGKWLDNVISFSSMVATPRPSFGLRC
ncbi:peptide transport system permease protein sapB [Vibrio variabilis]|uniref:Peptide transport system permease protein sapB n=1 Tax=Vibrio variabilis TaxID=990271 RepID=A0ABQ0JAF3_9VIBR|nr:peptide transport system permease protein sapB [Vibrio variabilis]